MPKPNSAFTRALLGSTLRTGRFKVPKNTNEYTLVVSDESLYRVYNSGEKTMPFTILRGGGDNDIVLPPSASVDVGVKTSLKIKSDPANDARGIYVNVEADNDVRSGRFKYDAALVTDLRMIVDGKGGPNNIVYRVMNSGKEPFTVKLDNTTVVELPGDNSVDVQISGERLTVSSANKPIEGIYEFLGVNG